MSKAQYIELIVKMNKNAETREQLESMPKVQVMNLFDYYRAIRDGFAKR